MGLHKVCFLATGVLLIGLQTWHNLHIENVSMATDFTVCQNHQSSKTSILLTLQHPAHWRHMYEQELKNEHMEHAILMHEHEHEHERATNVCNKRVQRS